MISFKVWMFAYMKDETGRGDLARDIFADSNFPETNNLEDLREYFNRQEACSAAIVQFEKALEEYNTQQAALNVPAN